MRGEFRDQGGLFSYIKPEERIPPPPFWRTKYFAFDVLPRRDYLDPIEIRRVIRRPERREVQQDGRVRVWGYAPSIGGYLRVVLLSD